MLAQKVSGNVQALVLAAGLGLRFGAEPKQLAMFEGKMLIAHVLEKIPTALAPIIITRKELKEEIANIAQGTQLIINQHPEVGLSNSLKLGLKHVKKDHHAMIFLADMPFIHKDTIKKLLAKFNGKLALAPSFGGKRGHPLCLPSPLLTKHRVLSAMRGLASCWAMRFPSICWNVGTKGSSWMLMRKKIWCRKEMKDEWPAL